MAYPKPTPRALQASSHPAASEQLSAAGFWSRPAGCLPRPHKARCPWVCPGSRRPSLTGSLQPHSQQPCPRACPLALTGLPHPIHTQPQPWLAYLLPASSRTLAPLSPLPRSSRTTSWMMRAPMKAYSSAPRRGASGGACTEGKASHPQLRRREGSSWGSGGSSKSWGRLEGHGSCAWGQVGGPSPGSTQE